MVINMFNLHKFKYHILLDKINDEIIITYHLIIHHRDHYFMVNNLLVVFLHLPLINQYYNEINFKNHFQPTV